MKATFLTHKAIVCIQTILLFLTLWLVWYSHYYYTLCWLEGFSFFSTLPDFTCIQIDFPADTFRYWGAYLLQFFRNPWLGAAIQSGLVTLMVVGLELLCFRLFKDARMLWLAFIPVPVLVAGQYGDITLERSVMWCVMVWGMVCLCYFPLKRPVKLPVPRWFRSWVWVLGLPLCLLGLSVYLLVGKDKDNAYQEELCCLDYHANHQEWSEILQQVSPDEAQKDEFKLRYVLLALSETGQLADHLFKYGIKNCNQFLFYGSEDPFDRNFNALFYRALEMPNEVIHQVYQQSLTSPFGFNFRSLRMLADTYLDLGNYPLANKYLEVLRHSSFHGDWVESRLPRLKELAACKSENEVKEGAPFVGDFLETMTSLVSQYPTRAKFVDLWLCGVLATKDAAYFYQAFQFVAPELYAHGERLPRYYEEALLLIALRDNQILERYHISRESRQRFSEFMTLLQSGKLNAAKAKYPDSYWSYVF